MSPSDENSSQLNTNTKNNNKGNENIRLNNVMSSQQRDDERTRKIIVTSNLGKIVAGGATVPSGYRVLNVNSDMSRKTVNLEGSSKMLELNQQRIVKGHTIPLLQTTNSAKPKIFLQGPQVRVMNITELKKVTPHVKLITPEVTNMSEITKKNLPELTKRNLLELNQKNVSELAQKNLSQSTQKNVSEITMGEMKNASGEKTRELRNYCRTCAGLKVPLVDIFSERGVQMRLSQQLKHLEDVKRDDGISTQMCMDCICDLKMSYKFFMQIQKAQVKLRSMNTLQKNVVKNSGNDVEEKSVTIATISPTNSPEKPIHVTKKSEKFEESTNIVSPMKIDEPTKQEDAEGDEEPRVKIEPEVSDDYDLHYSDDNDSIEEFDPDDPSFRSDVMDQSQEENPEKSLDNVDSKNLDVNSLELKNEQNDSQISLDPVKVEKTPDPNKSVYQYDTKLKAYVKIEPPDDIENENFGEISSREKTANGQKRETAKQPNILKRKGTGMKDFLEKPATRVDTSETALVRAELRQVKKPKLDVQNALNVTNEKENGVMYVTVKGTKPNEMLLVKVRKMEKPTDKRDDRKKPLKLESPENEKKKVKKVDPATAARDKEAVLERARQLDKREQIIEEQIEEYKKKREKVLGGSSSVPNALKFEDGSIRFVNPTENEKKDNEEKSNEEKNDEEKSNEEKSNEEKKEESKSETEEKTGEVRYGKREERIVKEAEEAKRKQEEADKKKQEEAEKTWLSTCDYLTRLARLKKKWEKRKRELAQLENQEKSNETIMEKLSRLLGDREKNLGEFHEYLKQRKIIFSRLKDEDIVTLYEDRRNVSSTKCFPDLIDASPPSDHVTLENYFDCDYCPETFSQRDSLEEHLKSHDYKLMYWCEDCRLEFPSIKSKRVHNAGCVKKLICRYCNIVLDSRGKKRQHEQKHVDSMYGQICEVCGEKFKHQATLDQHFKTQHMTWEKIYQCPKCPKKFAFKQKLTFHLKSVHTTLRAYLCEDCGADFKNPASLRHHRVRKHHPTSNKRACPVCSKIVPFYSLSKHMYTHKAYTINCPHCDKMFKNSSTLKQHIRIHEDQRQFRCDTCGVGFNRRDGLKLHMRVHQKTDSRAFKECSCQICLEKFPNHSMLVIHRNRVHKDGRQYTCHVCNRSMMSTRSLEWHMAHIHNETMQQTEKVDSAEQTEKKRVACAHCDKTFKTEMILRTHIKNTHVEKDPMKCLDCEQTFTSDVRLRHHMMIAHNRLEGTLTCPHCPKRFVNTLRLKTHMISHSEERPYTCELCGFNLKTKIQLIKHHQNRHSDERPLQCRYCPWRCKQVSALVCHERTHTNERPYSCIVCRQRFKYLGDKNKHERRHESLGGSGFKRIVAGRNLKNPKVRVEENSNSEHDHVDYGNDEGDDDDEEDEDEEEKFDVEEQQEYVDGETDIVKFEGQEIPEVYEENYEQEYEETSREASEAAEVIMNMEDTTVYTEEVTADNIEETEIVTNEIITNDIMNVQPDMTVVHLQQQDESGKIQVIPVMLSLPDLGDSNSEVNLATASIIYNS